MNWICSALTLLSSFLFQNFKDCLKNDKGGKGAAHLKHDDFFISKITTKWKRYCATELMAAAPEMSFYIRPLNKLNIHCFWWKENAKKTKQISELNAFWCVDKHIPNITGFSLVLVAAHCSPPARSQLLCPFPRSAGSSQGDDTSCSLPAGSALVSSWHTSPFASQGHSTFLPTTQAARSRRMLQQVCLWATSLVCSLPTCRNPLRLAQ